MSFMKLAHITTNNSIKFSVDINIYSVGLWSGCYYSSWFGWNFATAKEFRQPESHRVTHLWRAYTERSIQDRSQRRMKVRVRHVGRLFIGSVMALKLAVEAKPAAQPHCGKFSGCFPRKKKHWSITTTAYGDEKDPCFFSALVWVRVRFVCRLKTYSVVLSMLRNNSVCEEKHW